VSAYGLEPVSRDLYGGPFVGPRREDELVGGAASHRAEAVRAIDGLAARRAERHLGLAAAVAAGGAEHLARTAVAVTTATTAAAVAATTVAAGAVAPARAVGAVAAAAAGVGVAGRLAARPARRAPARFGEPALCVEVLLTRGEHELLAAIGAGQIFVAVHGIENSSR
jgi:hypothetical protein